MTTLSASVDNVDPYREKLTRNEIYLYNTTKGELNCVIISTLHTYMFSSSVLLSMCNYVGYTISCHFD